MSDLDDVPQRNAAPGSRRTARPRCASRSATRATCAGAAAIPVFKSEAQKALDGRDGRARLDRARLAEGLWRRRPVAGRDQDPEAGNGADRRAQSADELRHLDARPGAAQIWQRGAEEALPDRDRAVARSAGARAIPSPAPAPTSPRCRPNARTRAIIGWSTARRSGPAMPTRPTGSSAWSAPIPPRPSIRGSASSCSTWRARASRPGRSCSSPALRPSARPSSTT